MTIITVDTKVSYKYLMGKTKSELAYRVLELMDDLDKYHESLYCHCIAPTTIEHADGSKFCVKCFRSARVS